MTSLLRDLLWSDLCVTDNVSYKHYLSACEKVIGYGCGTFTSGDVDGTVRISGRDGRGADVDVGAVVARLCGRNTEAVELVGGIGAAGGLVDAQDHGNSRVSAEAVGFACGGFSVGGAGGGVGGVPDCGGGTDVSARRRGDGSSVNASFDGGPVQSQAPLVESGFVRGKNYAQNKRKREKKRSVGLAQRKESVPLWRRGAKPLVDGSGGCVSDGSSAGSVRTVDTRTGVEIEAAQTLAARRVAENKRAEVEAKVAAALAEHKLRALGDKGRTAVVERLAAARYEQRINEARLRAQKSFSASEDSLKSLGSMGSAGELYARQAIKKSRDDAKTLKYVQDQANYLLERASPEDRQAVAEMPAPVYDDEFEVFGDCPSDFDDEQREAYYADLNRANFEHGQIRVESEGHREATPEELLRIKEELAALSVY